MDSVSTSMSSSSSLEENQELNQPDGFFFFFTLSGASTAYCTQTQAKHSIISASTKLTFGFFAHKCVLCTKSVFPYQCSALFPNHSSIRSSSTPLCRGRNLGAPILCPLFKSLFCQIIINIIIQKQNLGSATTIYTTYYKSVPFTPKAQGIKYAIMTQKSGPHNAGICCFNHLEAKRKYSSVLGWHPLHML